MGFVVLPDAAGMSPQAVLRSVVRLGPGVRSVTYSLELSLNEGDHSAWNDHLRVDWSRLFYWGFSLLLLVRVQGRGEEKQEGEEEMGHGRGGGEWGRWGGRVIVPS